MHCGLLMNVHKTAYSFHNAMEIRSALFFSYASGYHSKWMELHRLKHTLLMVILKCTFYNWILSCNNGNWPWKLQMQKIHSGSSGNNSIIFFKEYILKHFHFFSPSKQIQHSSKKPFTFLFSFLVSCPQGPTSSHIFACFKS